MKISILKSGDALDYVLDRLSDVFETEVSSAHAVALAKAVAKKAIVSGISINDNRRSILLGEFNGVMLQVVTAKEGIVTIFPMCDRRGRLLNAADAAEIVRDRIK